MPGDIGQGERIRAMSDNLEMFELRSTLATREAVIRMLERDLRETEGKRRKLHAALAETVEMYGKPGGPWNVPGSPGSWIAKAKKTLEECL